MSTPDHDPLSQQVQQVMQAAMGSLAANRPDPPRKAPTARKHPSLPPDELADDGWVYPDTPVRKTLADYGPLPPPAPDPNDPHPPLTPNNLPFWYPSHINSATFDLQKYLQSLPDARRLLASSEGRKAATFADPLLFALVYFPHHLRDPNNPTAPPSFADCHFDWCRLALRWAANRNRTTPIHPAEDRIAEVAPRMCGKSTWWFLIIPTWAAAHGHKKFVAAFASTATQAEGHLRTFKNEIDNNKYLKVDFPDLCEPKRRPRGAVVADRVDTYQAANGFVFIGKGVDSSNLGMKVEETRPDLILLDDVEPDERMYSADLADKRLKTIQDAILQLNIYASVVFVGTVTMPNSIIHQIVKHSHGDRAEELNWISDEKINGHHYLPIVLDSITGEERSLWPEKWPLEYLKSIQHTRSYAKNYANDPKGREGDYWNDEDFTREPFTPTRLTRTALFLDPATTSTKTSDPAGIAVVSWNPPTTEQLAQPFEMEAPRPKNETGTTKRRAANKTIRTHPGTVGIRLATHVRLTGKPLARFVYKIIQDNPQLNIRRIVIEATQGGDLWLEVFADSPVMVEIINPKEGKETRFERALEYYQKDPTLVVHDSNSPIPLTALEEEQMAFPRGKHDDIADAGVSGTLYFLEPRPKKKRIRTQVRSYV